MIEEHIDFVDIDGRSVHLGMEFVRHYLQRHDNVLPTVVAIAQAPIILADGGLLAPDGLDRDRGILFHHSEGTARDPSAAQGLHQESREGGHEVPV
jgi:hypothetical protein